MKRIILLLFWAAVVALIVWGLIEGNKSEPLSKELQERLVSSSSFEALALNHIPTPDSKKSATNVDYAMDYAVLGAVKIDDRMKRQEMVNMVAGDIAGANHPASACMLEPRHGIRCRDGTNTVLVLICYHCGDVEVEQNGKTEYYLIKTGGSLRSPDSMKVFDNIFKEAGVKTDSN
jgi:hypothetical protein